MAKIRISANPCTFAGKAPHRVLTWAMFATPYASFVVDIRNVDHLRQLLRNLRADTLARQDVTGSFFVSATLCPRERAPAGFRKYVWRLEVDRDPVEAAA
jgi:hypothetical protein